MVPVFAHPPKVLIHRITILHNTTPKLQNSNTLLQLILQFPRPLQLLTPPPPPTPLLWQTQSQPVEIIPMAHQRSKHAKVCPRNTIRILRAALALDHVFDRAWKVRCRDVVLVAVVVIAQAFEREEGNGVVDVRYPAVRGIIESLFTSASV